MEFYVSCLGHSRQQGEGEASQYWEDRWDSEGVRGKWTEVLSYPFASIFIGKKTGPQIRNGRTNIIKRKLKPQIGGLKESI